MPSFPAACRYFALLILPLSLAACVSVQNTLPQDIPVNSSALDVHNRSGWNGTFGNASFDVGGFRVSHIRHEITDKSSFSIGPFRENHTKGGFSFTLDGTSASWRVKCNKEFNSNVVKVFGVDGVSNKVFLRCNLQGATAQQQAHFELLDEMEPLNGTVSIDGKRYALRPYAYGNVRHDVIPAPLGFRIDGNAGNLAALELRSPGRFWLNKDLSSPEQDALVGVMAALLIHTWS
ncbi:MAG: hypothetical protein RL748_1081 [Pseudomonadota bacterium]|jgi:hypothetical protein